MKSPNNIRADYEILESSKRGCGMSGVDSNNGRSRSKAFASSCFLLVGALFLTDCCPLILRVSATSETPKNAAAAQSGLILWFGKTAKESFITLAFSKIYNRLFCTLTRQKQQDLGR